MRFNSLGSCCVTVAVLLVVPTLPTKATPSEMSEVRWSMEFRDDGDSELAHIGDLSVKRIVGERGNPVLIEIVRERGSGDESNLPGLVNAKLERGYFFPHKLSLHFDAEGKMSGMVSEVSKKDRKWHYSPRQAQPANMELAKICATALTFALVFGHTAAADEQQVETPFGNFRIWPFPIAEDCALRLEPAPDADPFEPLVLSRHEWDKMTPAILKERFTNRGVHVSHTNQLFESGILADGKEYAVWEILHPAAVFSEAGSREIGTIGFAYASECASTVSPTQSFAEIPPNDLLYFSHHLVWRLGKEEMPEVAVFNSHRFLLGTQS